MFQDLTNGKRPLSNSTQSFYIVFMQQGQTSGGGGEFHLQFSLPLGRENLFTLIDLPGHKRPPSLKSHLKTIFTLSYRMLTFFYFTSKNKQVKIWAAKIQSFTVLLKNLFANGFLVWNMCLKTVCFLTRCIFLVLNLYGLLKDWICACTYTYTQRFSKLC